MPSSKGRAFTGAWIETPRASLACSSEIVAPSQARGLKHLKPVDVEQFEQVAPSQARGLKRILDGIGHQVEWSRLHRRVD